MLKERIYKFLDNPLVIFSFLRRHLWYRFVADSRTKAYRSFQFLSAEETIARILSSEQSLIRPCDGAFGYLAGASIYYNGWRFKYNRAFAKRLKYVMTEGQKLNILFCFPHEFIFRPKRDFLELRLNSEWRVWIEAKTVLGSFLKPGHVY
jgi:hypothetical protein